MSDPQNTEHPTESTAATGLKGMLNQKLLKDRGKLWTIGTSVVLVVFVVFAISWYWSLEPGKEDVVELAAQSANVQNPKELPLGYTYATSLLHVAETLLHKPGGFLVNDVFPPGVLLDNIPSWEYGALTALRDGTSALRNHIARAQTQSREDPDLAKTEPFFYFDHKSWQLPSSEAEYEKGIEALMSYRARLMDRDANFYSRADNLRQYLEVLEKRLGDLSNRLSASTGDPRAVGLDERRTLSRTPWLQIDDVFFEARGYTWAAMHILRAIEFDFRDILGNKTALVSLQAVIHELEDGQAPFLSPVILNGSGFGLFANYSLTLANYIARANAATIDLRSLLQQG